MSSSRAAPVWRAPYPMAAGIIPTQGPSLYLHQPQMSYVPTEAYLESERRRRDAEACADAACLALLCECLLLGARN